MAPDPGETLPSSDGTRDREHGRWESRYVRRGDGGLAYPADDDGNRIPDFSWAGYRLREEPIPDVPVVRTVGPGGGDDAARLQAVIDEVGAGIESAENPPERGAPADEIVGAVELEPGVYRLEDTLGLERSGVVLRGAGAGDDPAADTVIESVGGARGDEGRFWDGIAVRVGAGAATWENRTGEEVPVTTDFVRVGDRSFEVADASAFDVGENVLLHHPCTAGWLDAVDGGGTGADPDWTVGEQPIVYNREIRGIDGDEITIDAPVYNHLDRDLAESFVYSADRTGLVREVGIENLRVTVDADGDRTADESPISHAVVFDGVEDGWMTGCTTRNYSRSGVATRTTTRVTIRGCRAVDPFGPIEGGWRYPFAAEPRSQQILFDDCLARRGRHNFVSNGTSSASGIVFHDVTSVEASTRSEGHRRWTHGLLFDRYASRRNHPAGRHGILLGNRGHWGTAHGWGAAHSVVWNADLHDESEGAIVEKPPTAQNYAIGVDGPVGARGPFEQPPGHVEGQNDPGLSPASLYEAQLEDRLG